MSVALIIYMGESNSGGSAFNSDATTTEKASRGSVQILNNNTLAGFENLNITVGNNLYGHNGAETWVGNRHGWELQMANRVEAGSFIPSPCYLVKTGQGGSKVGDWDGSGGHSYNGSTNVVNPWAVFQTRVDKAIELLTALTGSAPRLYIMYSQGINDSIAGTNITTWKTQTLDLWDRIRTKYGAGIPFIVTKFPSNRDTINTAIDQLATQRPNVFPIDTLDCSLEPDGNHWDYAGMKTVSDRMLDALLANTNIIDTINVFANRPNVVVAKATKTFDELGFTADNMSIVYECGSSEAPKSWQPGRPINGIAGFEVNKGYYLMPLEDMALSSVLMPPTPEDL